LSSQEIGELIRDHTLGASVHQYVHQFPKLKLRACVLPLTRSVLEVDLTITPDFQWDQTYHGCVESFWIIVEDNDRENILHHEYFILKMERKEGDHYLVFTVRLHRPLPAQYFVRIVSN